MYGHKDLHWKDNRVHLDSRATGYSIVRDETYPIMWRVRHPDGSPTGMLNLTRARDGACCLALSVLKHPRKAGRGYPAQPPPGASCRAIHTS
jgi:hypothetical protein